MGGLGERNGKGETMQLYCNLKRQNINKKFLKIIKSLSITEKVYVNERKFEKQRAIRRTPKCLQVPTHPIKHEVDRIMAYT